MTKNPCRGCEYSWQYKGRNYPGFKKDNGKTICYCDKYKKHQQYLLSKRKFIAGDVITTLEELDKQEWVIWIGSTRHISVIMNLQYHIVKRLLSAGQFRYAIRREDNETK